MAFALGIGEIAALAARTFGNQNPGAIDPGRMELDKLHVLQGQPGPQNHGVAIAGAGVGRGAGKIGATIPARRKDHLFCRKTVKGAIVEPPGHQPDTLGIVIHDQVEGEILNEEFGVLLDGLSV